MRPSVDPLAVAVMKMMNGWMEDRDVEGIQWQDVENK